MDPETGRPLPVGTVFPGPQVDDWGQRMRAERERLGFSRLELSRMAGISEATIARWERGETPMAATMRKVRDVFNAARARETGL